MGWIILCIFLNVYIVVFFRIYTSKDHKVFPVVVWNYFFAALMGWSIFYFFNDDVLLRPSLVKAGFAMGGIFLAVFYLISRVTAQSGVATASLANKSGYVLPMIFSWWRYGEMPDNIRITAALSGLVFLVMALWEKKEAEFKKSYTGPVWLILGSGLIDVLMLWNNKELFESKSDSGLLSSCIFSSSFIIGCGIMLIQYPLRESFHPKTILSGALLGVPNFFSILFLLYSLESFQGLKGLVFAMVNIGIVMCSALAGTFIFKEKKTAVQWVGIAGLALCIGMMAA
ncbi:MAG: hypothetical protein N3F09_00805 [Bacteroidia bacterium]|nr:hypothetical protein [Bacteroidia bacterium]